MAYIPIPQNPYIVGNPIQSSRMFYGRNEDFLYIKDKLDQETKGLIVTLAGERRSGKTSILFQIMNGRLGEEFIPFFIDMQAMAAVESDGQFLARMDQAMRPQIDPAIPIRDYSLHPWQQFESLIADIKASRPDCKLIFLLDEYELIENKIEKHLISEELITFLANLMESHNVYFLFTGSNKLEERNTPYWKVLFSKSQYRKITFLKHNDCLDLITKPVEGYVNYTEEQQDKIWRLTAGQPFYTQIFCQNMVDRLQIEKRNDVLEEDIDAVIADIVDNPMPQMIYFWQELDPRHKLAMSLLAEVLQQKSDWADSQRLIRAAKDHKLELNVAAKDLHTAMEELYHRDILSKKGNDYQFRVDIFRFWVKQEQNIWKLLREIEIEKPPEQGSRKLSLVLAAVLIVIIAGALYFWRSGIKEVEFGSSRDKEATRFYREGSRYLEDGNYPLALKNADAALKADSLYFKAAVLKAETLKAMNRSEPALEAYGRAEELYTLLTSRLGKPIAQVADSLITNHSGRSWQRHNDIIVFETFNRYLIDIQVMRPTQHYHQGLMILHLKSGKTLHIPHAQYLAEKGGTVWAYDSLTQQVAAWDVKKGKRLWTYQTQKNEPGDCYFAGAYNLQEKPLRQLVCYNRTGLYVLDLKSGRELGKKLYPKGELRYVTQDVKPGHLIAFDEKALTIYRIKDLKELVKPLLIGSDMPLWVAVSHMIISVVPQTGTQVIYSYDPARLKLHRIFSTDDSASIALGDKALLFAIGDSLFHYDAVKHRSRPVALPGAAKPQLLINPFSAGLGHSNFIVFSEEDAFIMDNRARIIHTVSLSELGDEGQAADPFLADYDAARKRLVYCYRLKGEGESGAKTLAVFDLKKRSQVFSIKVGKDYSNLFVNKEIYSLVGGTTDYDGRFVIMKYSVMLMDPNSFRILPVENAGMMDPSKHGINISIGPRIFKVKRYPPSEERSLQSIHENMALLQDALGKPDQVVNTFGRMLIYLRTLNNPALSQAVVKALISQVPDDLGYYATKLRDADTNFASIQSGLEQAMNLKPNRDLPPVKLGQREYIRAVNEVIMTSQVDPTWTYLHFYRLEQGKRIPLYSRTRLTPAIASGEGLSLYHRPGQKTQLYAWKGSLPLRSVVFPYPVTTRGIINWLDNGMLYYISQKQAVKGFDYQISTLSLADGSTKTLKSWNSSLHLKRSFAYGDKIAVVMMDSVSAVHYIPSAQSEINIPAMAKITSCNSLPISSSRQIDPSTAPGFKLGYYHKGASGLVGLSPAEINLSLFGDFCEGKMLWFDPAASSLSEPVPFGYYNAFYSALSANYEHQIWGGHYLRELVQGVKYKALIITDIQTGDVTWIRGSDELGINNSLDLHWSKPNLFEYYGPRDANQIVLKMWTFDGSGGMRLDWQIQLPWYTVGVWGYTSTHWLVMAERKVGDNNISNAMLYLDRATGRTDRRVNLFNDMSNLFFESKPTIFYDPKLGFYDPVGP